MEFPELGKHCSFAGCGLLDFLPFECDKCHKVFCNDHRILEAHNCSYQCPTTCQLIPCPICFIEIPVPQTEDANHFVEKHIMTECAGSAKAQLKREQQNRCSLKRCKAMELTGLITCSLCAQRFCTAHRHPSDHKCASLLPGPSSTPLVGAVASTSAPAPTVAAAPAPIPDKMRSIMDQYATQVYKTDSARRRAEQIRNSRLRHLAKGQTSIPADKRFYLEVVFPLNKKLPSKIMFFDERWTVGKVLDEIANEGRIDNRNHLPGEEKWFVYSLETGQPLANSSRLSEAPISSFNAVLLEKASALVQ